MRLPCGLNPYLRLGPGFEICARTSSCGCEVSEQDGGPGCNNRATFPQRGTTSPQGQGARRSQRRLVLHQRRARAGRAALRRETTGQDLAWNHHAAGSCPACSEQRSDAGRGGHHGERARSRPPGCLRESSLRSRPHRPAKEPAACFPHKPANAHANDRRVAKRLRPKLSVRRSNSDRAYW